MPNYGALYLAGQASLLQGGAAQGGVKFERKQDAERSKDIVLAVVEAPLKTVESKLFFNGHAGKEGKENFLTMPSSCAAPSTSYLELETYPPIEHLSAPTTPPVSVEGCDKVPFAPTATVAPETSHYDTPDGVHTDVHVPQKEKASEINTADIADAHVTLPEGLTLNPSAAHGLEACTPGAARQGHARTRVDLPGRLQDRHGRNRNRPARRTASPATSTSASTTARRDHRPALPDLHRRREQLGVSVRLKARPCPNPATGPPRSRASSTTRSCRSATCC